MKIFIAVLGLAIINVSVFASESKPCFSKDAETSVENKSYSLRNHKKFPTYLRFGQKHAVSYGSALAGHPGGKFYYKGLCSGQVQVLFKQTLGPEADTTTEVLRLSPVDVNYEVLHDELSSVDFWKE